MKAFFSPRGIALICASDEGVTAVSQRADALRAWGYSGGVAIVDPRRNEYAGRADVVARVADLDPSYDVALVTADAAAVLPALRECAAAGIQSAVALAPGFEGPSAAVRKAELVAFLAATPEFRLIGPNCAGAMSAAGGAILSASSTLLTEPAATVGAGLVMQSGGIGVGLLRALLERGAGFAHWVSSGDELDLGAVAIATAMLDAPGCTAVGMFLEGLTDAELLPELRAAVSRTGKPVVAVRCGLTSAGRNAAFGHTGRIVGDAGIARAALEQAGVRVVATVDELCDAMTILSVLPPREEAGDLRVGVVVGAGGAGVIAADEIARAPGLRLADPSPVANPSDVVSSGDASVFPRAVQAMGDLGSCDVVVAVATTLAHDYERLASHDYAGLPPVVFAHMSPGEQFTPAQGRRLAAMGIPAVPSVEHAIRALAHWACGGQPATPPEPATTGGQGHRFGLIASGRVVGGRVDRWTTPAALAATIDEALAVAARLGARVAIKAEGSKIEHRSELGAVLTNLHTPEEVSAAYETVAAACAGHGEQVVVQAMASPGIEVFVSVLRDHELGPVALCRPGGLLVELGASTTVLTGPRSSWPSALEGSPLARLLAGYRGEPPADTAGLLDLVDDLLGALRADDGIVGIECNPVVVHPAERAAGSSPATIVDLVTYVRGDGLGADSTR